MNTQFKQSQVQVITRNQQKIQPTNLPHNLICSNTMEYNNEKAGALFILKIKNENRSAMKNDGLFIYFHSI